MNALSRSVVGIALAAGAVYLFDPVSGRRRRLILRDELTRAAHRLDDGTRRTRGDLSHRAQHIASQLKSDRRSDKIVVTGIRGVLKRAVSHPKAIAVAVHEGHVILRGDVLAHERDALLDVVRSVPGVRIVTDHLTARERAEGIRPTGAASANGWPITSGILLGATTCGLLVWGIKERKALGSWGQELWHASKREIDEVLAHVRRARKTGETQGPGRAAAEAAIDAVEAATEPGHPEGHRRQRGRGGDPHAQVA